MYICNGFMRQVCSRSGFRIDVPIASLGIFCSPCAGLVMSPFFFLFYSSFFPSSSLLLLAFPFFSITITISS